MGEEIDVGMKCIKYMLFVTNFMFVMIGFLLISIGSTIKSIYGDFDLFMESHYFSPAVLAIVIGVVIFFVALFGCIGAIKESTCLINLFGLFLSILLIMEISAAIAAYAMRADIESNIKQKMIDSMGGYNNDVYETDAWDFTQSELRCCGINSHKDWENYDLHFTTLSGLKKLASTPAPTDNSTAAADTVTSTDSTDKPTASSQAVTQTAKPTDPTAEPSSEAGTQTPVVTLPDEFLNVPGSCCRSNWPFKNQCHSGTVYKKGCLEALTYVVSESALLLGCGALAVAFIQLLGIIFAWMLAKAVRRLKIQQLVERDQNRQRAYEQLARGAEENKTPVLYTPTSSEA